MAILSGDLTTQDQSLLERAPALYLSNELDPSLPYRLLFSSEKIDQRHPDNLLYSTF